MKKRIAILGSTGSIGTQALEVIRHHPELFSVEVLTAQQNADLLIRQVVEFVPNAVVIGNEELYEKVKSALASLPVKVFAGGKAIAQVTEMDTIDLVLNALVGYAGLAPTLHALGSRKIVALANKETLVAAGDLVMKVAHENRSIILPVDSEHSAIFQCLAGEERKAVEKIILTASGGPFRGKTKEQLKKVRKEAALKHPNWNMGSKITIDSASMVNKGLEVIEARWLFDLEPSQIEVVIHPQSIIHSVVQFIDGSMKAQMGLPDMRLPIIYALAFPHRLPTRFPRFDFHASPVLNFDPPDKELFRGLALAYRALEKGGNAACILNAANEVAVAAFLEDRIGFLDMAEVIEFCMDTVTFLRTPGYNDYMATNEEAQRAAREFIRKISTKNKLT